MLVIKRKENQKIHIGNDITLLVTDIGRDAVKIGIEAPESLIILRDEVLERERKKLEVNPGDMVEYIGCKSDNPFEQEQCKMNLVVGIRYRVSAVTCLANAATYRVEGCGNDFDSVSFRKVVS